MDENYRLAFKTCNELLDRAEHNEVVLQYKLDAIKDYCEDQDLKHDLTACKILEIVNDKLDYEDLDLVDVPVEGTPNAYILKRIKKVKEEV